MRRFQDLVRPPSSKACRFTRPCFQAAAEDIRCCLSTNRGNILVFIVMVMVIFAALGVTMLSLFSSSKSGTAPADNQRRAFNLYESGYRYALSELTSTSFSSASINTLNTTTYTLNPDGQFFLNVFGPWFDSIGSQDLNGATTKSLNLNVPRLRIINPHAGLPTDFTIQIPTSAPYVSVVNYDYIGVSIPASGNAEVTGFSYPDRTNQPTHITLTVNDDFVANDKERICLAVHPYQDQTVSYGGSLTVAPLAQGIFPKLNGSIKINRQLLFYRERQDDPGNAFVSLTGLKGTSGSFTSFPVTTTDFAILSPANYYIVPEGLSEGVSYGAKMTYALSTYDVTPFGPNDPKPDIQFDAGVGPILRDDPEQIHFRVHQCGQPQQKGDLRANQRGPLRLGFL